MQLISREWLLVLLLILASVWFAHAYFGGFAISDAFERARAAGQLLSGGYPVESTAIGAGATKYPPLFDFFLASFKTLTGVSIEESVNAASYVFAVIFFGIVTLLASSFITNFRKEETPSIVLSLSAMAFFLSPWVFYRVVTPISETLGLALYLLVIYAFLRGRERWLVFLALLSLSFAHFRSFAIAMAALAMLSLFTKRVRELVIESFLALLVFVYFVPRPSLGFSNPLVVSPGVLDFFSVPLLAGALAGAVLLAFDRRGSLVLFALLGAPLLVSFLAPFSFRQLAYLPVALSILTAYLLLRLCDGNVFQKVAVPVFLVAAIVSLAFFVTSRQLPVSLEDSVFASRLALFPKPNVAGGFVMSYAIPFYSAKKVVLGSFAEELPDFKSRIYATQQVLNGTIDRDAAALLAMYDVGIVVTDDKPLMNPAGGITDLRFMQSDSHSAYQAG